MMNKHVRRSALALAVLAGSLTIAAPNALAAEFNDSFNSLDQATWNCEITCPTVTSGRADFRLSPGIPPRQEGSWSKIGYKPQRFTEGEFAIRFKLSARPTDRAVWWGLALWDDGPNPDGSEYNEINFGYTTDQSFGDTELRFESARRGNDVSLRVDTGVDLYDGSWHTGTLKYDANSVQFYLDDRLLETINDTSVIPTDPMELVVGPRLVGPEPLETAFTESVDWAWFKTP